MLNWQPSDRRLEVARHAMPISRGHVDRFLIESELRLVGHCQHMLARDDLEDDVRQRLLRLLREADARLQRLAMTAA